MKASEIRKKFVEYFKKQGHAYYPSSPLIPENDPTLLFANAGMNQFKTYFTGKVQPKDKRVVTHQKCVRAGGKHNDLENVGFTARHHTFFEMLGNFSFGDYFKKNAIQMAWSFLTEELKISKDRLLVTVHLTDDEAYNIWVNDIKVPKDKIFRKDKDNFWEMGEFGPCGPSSEIFYDHGEEHKDPDYIPAEGDDILNDENRYVEIWNLVFMQYEKTPEGQINLPNPCIDTGSGLERLAAVMQGVYWNYDTDCFAPIIEKISKLTGKNYQDPKHQMSMRVVADHIRGATMLISDGVLPSNEGRGYVLRRIIRRAIRYLRELGSSEVCFYKLVPAVFKTLGTAYKENERNQGTVEKFLEIEEKKFLETLDLGLKFLGESIDKMDGSILSGEVAFKLYDTFGLPLDLTQLILKEKNLKIDNEGYQKCMENQKKLSRESWKGGEILGDSARFSDLVMEYGETNFTGHQKTVDCGKLLKLISINDKKVGLIFDKTPFYGESGGQVGDTGQIEITTQNYNIRVLETQKPVDGLHVHLIIKEDSKKLQEGKEYSLKVDNQVRDLTTRNHSATHLLQQALIDVLGDHVKQSGSYVSNEKLRFDFTHFKGLTQSELNEVERNVNNAISQRLQVSGSYMSKEEAINQGALALFGEKYGEKVRVIKMGEHSVELCGGTHVENTSEIGHFKIISEQALSSGIRRIEALTSSEAILYLEKRSQELSKVEKELNTKSDKVLDIFKGLKDKIKQLEKENKEYVNKLQKNEGQELFTNLKKLPSGYLFKAVELKTPGDLRNFSDLFVDKFENGILLIYSKSKDRISILLRTHKKNSKIDCGKILKNHIVLMEGKGGGRKDMAQGQGKAGKDLKTFIQKVEEELS